MAELLDTLLRRATGFLALVGAIGVIAMLLHICAYVIGRHFAAAPVPATVELVSNYYMVLIAFLPIAWAERRGDMIVVEVFGPLFRGPLKRINAVFVALVTAGAYGVLAHTTWVVAMREFAAKSYVISLSTNIPVWPSYFVLPVSFALACAVCLLRIGLVVTGRPLPGKADALPKDGIAS